jgi:hypothetical protein
MPTDIIRVKWKEGHGGSLELSKVLDFLQWKIMFDGQVTGETNAFIWERETINDNW